LIPEHAVSADLLAQNDVEMLTRFSPRQVWGDGNCFYRAASLGFFGTQQYHSYLHAVTAFFLIVHPELYDPNSPSFVLHETCVCSPSIRSSINSALVDGSYAELVHLFALSAELKTSIQSYCTPGTHHIDGPHPYSIRIDHNDFRCPSTYSDREVSKL